MRSTHIYICFYIFLGLSYFSLLLLKVRWHVKMIKMLILNWLWFSLICISILIRRISVADGELAEKLARSDIRLFCVFYWTKTIARKIKERNAFKVNSYIYIYKQWLCLNSKYLFIYIPISFNTHKQKRND